VSNEDKRRRRDGSTAQLSVAELLARREAETQPIPVYRDDAEDTVRFKAVAPAPLSAAPSPLSGRELHVAELLRREGRRADEERGGMSISRLVAIASGGVVLCGSVAFGASQWLSSPDQRPLADVRFDDSRPAARNSSNSGDLGGVAMREAQPGTNTPAPNTTTPTQQQQGTPTQQPNTQAPGTQTPGTGTSTSNPTSQSPTAGKSASTPPPSTSTQAPPSSSSPTPPSSTPTPPPSSSTPPPSSSTPTPPPSSPPASNGLLGLGVGVGLGVGGFDFFAKL
jgi:hypothetical protein